ncbi:unnamed protein product [Caenorhabditis bovis]|uniref:Uncharacterized protein n=1 Tax=Caenorhabditis bovis TaxID=2654633 RepID=A0A8S1EXR9_9PELO|nr:unnamed protein product [Caenorhabditis bovis]
MQFSCLIVVLIGSSLAAAAAAPSNATKEEPAAGRHYRPPPPSYSSYGSPYYGFIPPVLQDRFVCDLDASVLLMTESSPRYHGYNYATLNRAIRVKCSEVANYDEDSCNACCQQTARRDTTLANDKLFGFLSVVKEADSDKAFVRTKRSYDEEDDDEDNKKDYYHYNKIEVSTVEKGTWAPGKYNDNVKCVCCAPRPSASAPSQPTYGAPINTFQAQTYGSPVNAFQPPTASMPAPSWAPVDTFQAPQAWGAAAPSAPASSAPAQAAAAPAPAPAAAVQQY